MPYIGHSQGPTTCSTLDFRGSRLWEAFRGLEPALVLVLKVSEIGPDNTFS